MIAGVLLWPDGGESSEALLTERQLRSIAGGGWKEDQACLVNFGCVAFNFCANGYNDPDGCEGYEEHIETEANRDHCDLGPSGWQCNDDFELDACRLVYSCEWNEFLHCIMKIPGGLIGVTWNPTDCVDSAR